MRILCSTFFFLAILTTFSCSSEILTPPDYYSSEKTRPSDSTKPNETNKHHDEPREKSHVPHESDGKTPTIPEQRLEMTPENTTPEELPKEKDPSQSTKKNWFGMLPTKEWTQYPSRGADKGPEPSGDLQQKFIHQAVQKKAVCNDGSPADYYIRYGTGQNRNNWIIHFKGGKSCQTIDECKARWKSNRDLMSSKQHPKTLKKQGIMNPSRSKNPDFYNWTHVFIYYCSSDAYIGNQQANTNTGNYHFQGYNIVKHIIQDLKNSKRTTEPTLAKAKLVLMTGSSAGAGGMRQHLNGFGKYLAPASVIGVSDSAFAANPLIFTNIQRALSSKPDDVKFSFWNAKPDIVCTDKHGKEKCLGFHAFFQNLQQPHFAYMDQIDYFTLNSRGYKGNKAKTDAFAADIRKAMQHLKAGFSTRSGYHTAILSDSKFFQTKVQGQSYAKVLANFLFQRNGPQIVIKP